MAAMLSLICPIRAALLTSILLFSTSWLPAQSQSQSSQPPSAQPAQSKAEEAAELVKQGQKLNTDGKLDESLALYQRALSWIRSLPGTALHGRRLDLQGNYEEARQYLAKAIELATEQQTVAGAAGHGCFLRL